MTTHGEGPSQSLEPEKIEISVCTQEAVAHIRYLSQVIGGRGSCTENEKQAADYLTGQLNGLGLGPVEHQPFKAIPSTYWGYGLSFTSALTGSALVLVLGGRDVLILAAILSLLGIWGMLAETDLASNWTRWILPKSNSQNVLASILTAQPSGGGDRSGGNSPAATSSMQLKTPPRNVVLCAHFDTHRTPIIYSSETWYRSFTLLVSLSFLSMVLSSMLYGLAALFYTSSTPILSLLSNQGLLSTAALIFLVVQGTAGSLCIQADFTPYSPGANDNASGVGAVLALAGRLKDQPLQNTQVHLLFTGCEEVGDRGIAAFLDAHAARLGRDAVYIILDEIALGEVKYLERDGLLFRRRTHPHALAIARQAQQLRPDLHVKAGHGLAYTDALQATRRGLPALTICTVPRTSSQIETHWHRMTDTPENISEPDLQNAIEFTWTVLKVLDQQAV